MLRAQRCCKRAATAPDGYEPFDEANGAFQPYWLRDQPPAASGAAEPMEVEEPEPQAEDAVHVHVAAAEQPVEPRTRRGRARQRPVSPLGLAAGSVAAGAGDAVARPARTFLASRRYMSLDEFGSIGRACTHAQLEALRRSDQFGQW